VPVGAVAVVVVAPAAVVVAPAVVVVAPAVVLVEVAAVVVVVAVNVSSCSLTTLAMLPFGSNSRYFCQARTAASLLPRLC
jgi:hypothetical protein